jgi:peptidoglycan hydrolase-like protein with peptidoglycan-binding domain
MDNSVRLTAEQRTKIRQTVLSGKDVPRVDRVNFSLTVGTVVPSHVRVVVVPPALIEIHPEWRGHQYFVAEDEIIIVDHSHKIVATVPVGSSSAQGATGSFMQRNGAEGSLNLSGEEIRQVQIMLKQKGFALEVDGMFGPQTKKALVEFQERQGIQASGQIDSRTMTALGLSDKIGGKGRESGSKPSTAGQGDRMQRSPADQDRGAAKQDEQDGNRSSMGQGGDRTQPSSANRDREAGQQDKGQPSTTGQGTDRTPQSTQDGAGGRDRMQQAK